MGGRSTYNSTGHPYAPHPAPSARIAAILPPRFKWAVKDFIAIHGIITGSWVNVLLLFVPLGIMSGLLDWGPVQTFTLVRWHTRHEWAADDRRG